MECKLVWYFRPIIILFLPSTVFPLFESRCLESMELVPLTYEMLLASAEPTSEWIHVLWSLFFLSEDIVPVFREFIARREPHGK